MIFLICCINVVSGGDVGLLSGFDDHLIGKERAGLWHVCCLLWFVGIFPGIVYCVIIYLFIYLLFTDICQ